MSIFLFCASISGVISTALVGQLQSIFNASANPRIYGYILSAVIGVAHLSSLPFVYKAGKAYTKFMNEKSVPLSDKK